MLTIDQFLPKSAGAPPSSEDASIVHKHDIGLRLTRHAVGGDVTFVVWDNNTIIAQGTYNARQGMERLAEDDKIQTLYRVLARGAQWLLVTIADLNARGDALNMYNNFVEEIAKLEGYTDPRVDRAMESWKEEGEILHHGGDAVIARAEALYLAFPTWNYEIISKEINGVKMEAMVQYGIPGVRLLFTHKVEDEATKSGQELKRWYTYPLNSNWHDMANQHLVMMEMIATGNKPQADEPIPAKPLKGRPTQPFKCDACGAEYVITPVSRFDAVRVRCKECGHNQTDAYRAK